MNKSRIFNGRGKNYVKKIMWLYRCNRTHCRYCCRRISSDNADFTEYNDTMVRRLVEHIRVMKDKTIIIVLKGGLQIEEKLEQI